MFSESFFFWDILKESLKIGILEDFIKKFLEQIHNPEGVSGGISKESLKQSRKELLEESREKFLGEIPLGILNGNLELLLKKTLKQFLAGVPGVIPTE